MARTRLEWARMLLARGDPTDTGRAREMAGAAFATAKRLGLPAVERHAGALLDR